LTVCDSFGYGADRVAISGDTIAAIYYGGEKACIYERSSGTWTTTAKLVPADSNLHGFGASVGLSGNTLVVGAGISVAGGTNEGAVVVFHRDGGVWAEETTLTASDAKLEDNFGSHIAIWRDTVIVGAAGHDGVLMDSGAAYLFLRAADRTWTQVSQFVPDTEVADSRFGAAVAISADTALVGAFRDKPQGSASAYGIVRNQAAECDTNEQCSTGFCANNVCCDSACVTSEVGTCLACSIAAGAQLDGVCSVALPDACSNAGNATSGGNEPVSTASGCVCRMGWGTTRTPWIGAALLSLLLGCRRMGKRRQSAVMD